jgi:hypothetical protein
METETANTDPELLRTLGRLFRRHPLDEVTLDNGERVRFTGLADEETGGNAAVLISRTEDVAELFIVADRVEAHIYASNWPRSRRFRRVCEMPHDPRVLELRSASDAARYFGSGRVAIRHS